MLRRTATQSAITSKCRYIYSPSNSSHNTIADFRSDTVTTPTEEMLNQMVVSKVGDDVFQDDPTTLHLESLMAEITGKEAALFVLSGTMSNQLALISQLTNPSSVILPRKSHINVYN